MFVTFRYINNKLVHPNRVFISGNQNSVHLTNLIYLVAIAGNLVFSAPTHFSSDSNSCSYPLTNRTVVADGFKYRIAMISDLDAASKTDGEAYTWHSYFQKGYLSYYPNSKTNMVSIEWDSKTSTQMFTSHLSENGRGLEMSELVTYNCDLITFDDKTGMAYVINEQSMSPWIFLAEGDGVHDVTKGMKCEWATVKGSNLYVGTHGIETRKPNQPVSYTKMWVKIISIDGTVEHVNWYDNYKNIQKVLGVEPPGYVTHEALVWSDIHQMWFILPRKVSTEAFNENNDEHKGSNVLLIASPDFKNIRVVNVGPRVPDHGFSSLKFLPFTEDSVIVAIKTMEVNSMTATYMMVFTIDGEVLYPETQVSEMKFEGLEFI